MLSRSSIAVFERYCQNQIFEGVHFEIQIGGPKRFPFKWKHWFLVSERSELSKNVYIYNSPKNMNERFFLDIATLTIASYHISLWGISMQILDRTTKDMRT